ncbi:hypothetical protein GCM10023178_07550 [Actinomadura luteofluorescens]
MPQGVHHQFVHREEHLVEKRAAVEKDRGEPTGGARLDELAGKGAPPALCGGGDGHEGSWLTMVPQHRGADMSSCVLIVAPHTAAQTEKPASATDTHATRPHIDTTIRFSGCRRGN